MDCLDEDAVLAFVDGHLSAPERSAAENHLASCPSCSDLIAAAAGADPARLSSSQAGGDEGRASGLARGATVGRYVILDVVGRGGMGEVYAAYDPQLDRKVALKLLHDQAEMRGGPAAARAGRQRLLREAKVIARLSHPNVVVVHDAGEIDDRVFLAMEFIDGQTLSAWLAEASRGWRAIRAVFLAAGEGLAAAHEAGLVHRDFKPQNVMVARDGSVRVTDFGLARDTGAGSEAPAGTPAAAAGAAATGGDAGNLTRTGMLLGTPLYMAPEQFLARPTDARTDQFSFSIALYEALYGERPFRADSFAALADQVAAGRVQEPSSKTSRTRAPAFLRKLLLRGLRADPAARYASMRELLSGLRHDPARRRRGLAVAAAIAALVIAFAAGAQRWATRGQRLCRAGGDRLAEAWTPAGADGGERRATIQRAFAATGLAFAADTWGRVSTLLDDYAQRWSTMYTDACQATHVRGDQSSEVLDLRMTCLEGPRGSLRALTDVLARADTSVVVQAVNAAQALPPLDRCADVPALRATVPVPADAATRVRVAELRRELAETKALTDTGQFTLATRKAGPIVAGARAINYAPLLAEALEQSAWLGDKLGEGAAAAKFAEEAVYTALAGRRDDVALECAALLVAYYGYHLDRVEDAEPWDRLAHALLERAGPGHERAAAWLINDRAILRWRRGDKQGGLALVREGLALKQRVLGPNHPDVGVSWANLGSFLEEAGDARGSLDAADRFLETYRSAYGADSPLLAHPLGNRGAALILLGRHAEAEKDLRDAIARWSAVVGPDHPLVAHPLTALGKSLIEAGRARDAAPILERAVRIRERGEPVRELVAESRFALARARWGAGAEGEETRALAVAARDAYRALPGHAREAEEIDAWLSGHGRSGARSR